MRISDWSSDVCSSDLQAFALHVAQAQSSTARARLHRAFRLAHRTCSQRQRASWAASFNASVASSMVRRTAQRMSHCWGDSGRPLARTLAKRSEEHTSELQSLMRISYAVFCLKKKTIKV